MRKVLFLFAMLGLACVMGCSTSEETPLAPQAPGVEFEKTAVDYGLNVLPPDAEPFGKSYSEWSAAWWQWLWSAPADQNPGLDATGENVDWNQSGPVWFLAPAYYGQWERTATIPNGKMLFIDLAGFFASIVLGDGADEAELRANTEMWMGIVSDVVLEVDGQRLQNVEDFRFQSPAGLFGFTLPEGHMFEWFGYDVPAGIYENDAVSEGYYAMLPPLTPGEHTIFLSADFGDPYNDLIQVTYHLTVAKGRSQHCMKH